MTPGLYTDVTREQYDAIDALNFSRLKLFGLSPKHFRVNYARKSKAMEDGTLKHMLLLEPVEFERRVVVYRGPTEGEGSRKEKKSFLAANAGNTVVTLDERLKYERMRSAVRDSKVMRVLTGGDAEATIIWDCDGIRCKSRVDYVRGDEITDLKFARDITPSGFGRAVANMAHHAQAAFYVDALSSVLHRDARFVWAAVEQQDPYDAAIYRADDDVLQIGRDLYRSWLQQYQECRHTNRWPGVMGDFEELTLRLPAWAAPREDDDLTDLGLE